MQLKAENSPTFTKMSKTSKTEKYLWDTKFSHYLGQKHDRYAKKLKFYEF